MNELSKHIERMMKPYREIQKITKPMREFQEKWNQHSEAIQNIIKPNLPIQKALDDSLKGFQKSFENIDKIYASLPEFQNPFLDNVESFREIGERLKEYIENTPEHFLLIAQHGWFIDFGSGLNLPSKVAHNLQEGKVDIANELLIDYYKTNINVIFDTLIKRHHNRREILENIKKSYKENNHTLIIPVILTQVDGICFDFTRKKFFIKEKENKKYKWLPEVIAELEKSAGNFLNLYLSPLQNQTPIMVREKDLNKFPCKLNRHEILHGIRTDYGTEINSLKVISLLKYVSDLITDLDKKALNIVED